MSGMNIIDVKNSQGVVLKGCLFDVAHKDVCVLFIPGMAGNIIENKFIQVFGEEFQKKEIGFVCGHNQGSFHIVDLPCDNQDGFVRRGVAFERFDDCISDIDAYINFIIKLGYERIVLIGHSLGANKVIYYLSQNKSNLIKCYVLLGAPDMAAEVNLIDGKDKLIDEAKKNIKNGKPDRLLSKLIWDYYILSSARFVDLIGNENSHNLPITSGVGSFEQLKSIQLPLLAVAGERDDCCSSDIEKYLSTLIEKSEFAGEHAIIKDAGHTYVGREKELFNVVYNFISYHLDK